MGVLPARIGPYEVVRLLGQGGMGVVYEVRAPGKRESYALKQLLEFDPTHLERFRREARAMELLSEHENIVRLHASGEIDGKPYLVMELCAGGSMADRYHKKKLAEREAAGVLVPIARAIHFIHELGVVHRDLKPQNVLYDAQGRAKVTDLGIAKNRRERALTATGQIFGTPTYMAPEQAQNAGDVDRRADVWALGAMLFHLVTGKTPFEGEVMSIVKRLVTQEPPSVHVHDRGLSSDLAAICAKALARDRKERYPTAEAFAQDLERLVRGQTPVWAESARARFLASAARAVGAVALVATVAAGVVLVRGRGARPHEDAEPLKARIAALETEAVHLRATASSKGALDHLAGAPLDAEGERELAAAKTPLERARALVAAAWRIPRTTPDGREHAARIVEFALALDDVAVLVDLDPKRRHEAGDVLLDAAGAALLGQDESEAGVIDVARRRLVRGRILAPRDRSTIPEAQVLARLSDSKNGAVQYAARPTIGFGIWSDGALINIHEAKPADLKAHSGVTPPLIEELVRALTMESSPETRRRRDGLMEALLVAPECAPLWARINRESIYMGEFAFAFRCAQEASSMAPDEPFFHERLGDAYLGLRRYEKAVEELETARRAKSEPYRAMLLVQAYMRLGRLNEAEEIFPEVATSGNDSLIEMGRKLRQRMDRMR